MIIKFKKLSIKEASVHDVSTLNSWWNDGKVMAHAGFYDGLNQSLLDTKNNVIQSINAKTYKRMILIYDKLPIGECNFKLHLDKAEIGIKICESDYQNKGLGPIYLKMLINYLFKTFDLKKIILDTNVKNTRAQHVYEKLGFIKIRTNIGSFKDSKGVLQDSIDYELKREDFYFMNKYKVLLFDVDNTILNFDKAEKVSISKSFKDFNIKVNEDLLAMYHDINLKYWEKVERNEITREHCLVARFKELFNIINVDIDPVEFENNYRDNLNRSYYVMKDAHKVLNILSKKYKLYIITNGVKKTQYNRLKHANMHQYFIKEFVSEDIGYSKPSIDFIKHVKSNVKDFNVKDTLIIGDSLTGDIKLANNANIDSMWFNYNGKKNITNITPTYHISSLLEILLNLE